MKRRTILVVVGIVAALAAAFVWGNLAFKPVSANRAFALQAPDPDLTAGNTAIGSLLDNEAGISAYFQTTPVTLSAVRSVFRSIETETSNYILGTVTLTNNLEEYDVHVYIHQSGWVLIYYLKVDPTVMIFDWQNYTGTMNPTRLQVAANMVMSTLSRANPTITYYDFRYPNATNLLLAIEDVQTKTATEEIIIPVTNFTYFERSWFFGGRTSPYIWSNGAGNLKIDSVEIKGFSCNACTNYYYGIIDAVSFPSNSQHAIQVNSWSGDGTPFLMGAIAIVYGP
jgi:hypothetical protein